MNLRKSAVFYENLRFGLSLSLSLWHLSSRPLKRILIHGPSSKFLNLAHVFAASVFDTPLGAAKETPKLNGYQTKRAPKCRVSKIHKKKLAILETVSFDTTSGFAEQLWEICLEIIGAFFKRIGSSQTRWFQTWLFAIFARKRSFVFSHANLRSFADLCLDSSALICALLHSCTSFCPTALRISTVWIFQREKESAQNHLLDGGNSALVIGFHRAVPSGGFHC